MTRLLDIVACLIIGGVIVAFLALIPINILIGAIGGVALGLIFLWALFRVMTIIDGIVYNRGRFNWQRGNWRK
jgi:hypothetical protein